MLSPTISWRTFLILLSILIMTPIQAQAWLSEVDLSLYSPQSYKAREIHQAVKLRVIGEKENRVFIFIPASPAPDNEVPVIFFHHGWQIMNPMNFGSLIDHLVRSGHVVIYPVFQDGERTSPLALTRNAGEANRAALNKLAEEFSLTPKQGQTLYYGFSIGAAIAVNLALAHQDYGLPAPDAMMLVAPGDAYHLQLGQSFPSIYNTLEYLPASLPIVIMTGEDDDIGLPTARALYARLKHIPREHRILYTIPTSRTETRQVTAGHGSPGAPDSRYNFPPDQQRFPTVLQGLPAYEKSASLNQLDFFGYWKIMDSLLDGLKNNGQFTDIVFGTGSPQQLNLGVWDNGTPLNPMTIENMPGE